MDLYELGRVGQTGMAGALISLALAAPLMAQDADTSEAVIQAGRPLWNDAGCANCHGGRGEGGGDASFPMGPSLRTSGLDAEGFELIIGCGIPGGQMPAFLEGAYTEQECFGMPVGSAPSGMIVSGMFDSEQIAALVEYIVTEIQVSQ